MADGINSAPPHQDRSYQRWLLTSGSRNAVVEWLQWYDPAGAYTDNESDRAGLPRLSLRAARTIMRPLVCDESPEVSRATA